MTATSRHFLAVDLGASSGRVIDARFDGRRMHLDVVHRFPNRMIHVPDRSPAGRWCWDVLALWSEIKTGLRQAASRIEGELVSIGVDSWGVDYALVGQSGRLLSNPASYRDPRNQASMERVQQILGRDAIYRATGIQFLPFNSIYQLAADALDSDALLERSECVLMIPDLFHYWLTGRRVSEHTNASTTQLYDPRNRRWISEFCHALHIPVRVLPEVIDAGSVVGPLLRGVAEELGVSAETKVVAPATHDTGSAVVGTPLIDPEHEAFLSSGTWSLLGIELTSDIRSVEAQSADFTNEAGYNNTYRFLTNRAGMWLVQECLHEWNKLGFCIDSANAAGQAASVPGLRAMILPDDPVFTAPGDMPSRIVDYCRTSGQFVPSSPAEILRVIFDSLALRYAQTLDKLAQVSRRSIQAIRIVGGGANNDLLNQLTASATGCDATAGPAEATAMGNALVQAITAGELTGLTDARRVLLETVKLKSFDPGDGKDGKAKWNAARERFNELQSGHAKV
jgi:rhamnulokinase